MSAQNSDIIEAVATAFRRAVYTAWCNTLIGARIPDVEATHNRMKRPVVGDWVIEASTIYGGRNHDSSDLDGVGILEEVDDEPIVFSDPEFAWDENEEGRPHPTERVHYIRTLDGRRFRWINADIIASPDRVTPLLEASRAEKVSRETSPPSCVR